MFGIDSKELESNLSRIFNDSLVCQVKNEAQDKMNLANLDLFAFDASSQENFGINAMKMGYKNRDTSRGRDGRHRTPERRPRSNDRGRSFGRGQSPGNRPRPRSGSRQRYDQPYSRQRPRSTSTDRIQGCLRCGDDHKAENCTLEYSAEKCPTGCGYFHKERDCPGKKSSGPRQSRRSSFGPTMAYRRYRTPGGRSTSYTRNEQGQRYREMVSPGGSKYREFRKRSGSGERRPPNLTKPGTRQGRSPGRQSGTAYRVQTVAVEDQNHSHKSDEYTSPNLYASPEFTSN